jgi:hypothetical protein
MKKIGPLAADHPVITGGTMCAACSQPIVAGDYVTLISLGPGDNEDERIKAREGRPYNAVAITIHWLCAGGKL